MYSIVIPLQQGLRPADALHHADIAYSIVIPLQQGLRRCRAPLTTQSRQILSSFHYNKD